MWGRYPPPIDTSPHIGDPVVITTTWLQHATFWSTWSQQQQIACSHCTTAQHCSQPWTFVMENNDVNTGARHHYNPTGRTFIADNPSKRRFLNDRVPWRAHLTTQVVTHYDTCVANGTSHSHSRMTAVWPQPGITPGPHGTQPLVAGHRRRTPNTYGVKHRSTAREASHRRHCLNTPRPAYQTTSTVRFSPFTPLSVPPSYPSPSTPINNLRGRVVWQLRTGRWLPNRQRRRLQWRHLQERLYAAVGTIAWVACSERG
jgi:hypothetical protein